MGKLRMVSAMVLVALCALLFAVGMVVISNTAAPVAIYLPVAGAFAVFVVFVQYLLGPVLLDWILQVKWTTAHEFGPEFADWNRKTCATFRIDAPRIGVIEDGMPNAFTYGYGRASGRVIVSRGLVDALDPDEFKAVYAHELGHIRNGDFVLMTLVQGMVLLLYIFARTGGRDRMSVVLTAYAAYWVSYYISLAFSRVREYLADYASAQILSDPNALSRALVKISYGLAQTRVVNPAAAGATVPGPVAPTPQAAANARMANAADRAELIMMQYAEPKKDADFKAAEAEQKKRNDIMRSLGAFGIANSASIRTAVSWYSPTGGDLPTNFTKAARWEMFNPWAKIAELVSTHPLTVNRIKALQKLNVLWGHPNEFDFTKIEPAKYGKFGRDLFVVALPLLGVAVGAAAATLAMPQPNVGAMVGGAVIGMSVLSAVALVLKYPVGATSRYRVLSLLGTVDVSHVNPQYVVLEGTFTGRLDAAVPWANDFILQDDTGYVACLYRQPFFLWEALFGFLGARSKVGRPVRVYGWYRRFGAPFVEIDRFELLDTRETTRCYHLMGAYGLAMLGMAAGAALLVLLQ